MQLPDWTLEFVLMVLAYLLGALSALGSSTPAVAFPYRRPCNTSESPTTNVSIRSYLECLTWQSPITCCALP